MSKFNEVLKSELESMAVNHLEAWKERYWNYLIDPDINFMERVKTDLYTNHDPSLKVERIEELLNRELTAEEETELINKFNEKVLNIIK